MEKKITMKIEAEFYPAENDEFQTNNAGLSESEQIANARAMVEQTLSENSGDGLWFRVESEDNDPIVWQSTIRQSMVENLSAEEVAEMIDDLDNQIVRGAENYDLDD
jgi:hypothetical protein